MVRRVFFIQRPQRFLICSPHIIQKVGSGVSEVIRRPLPHRFRIAVLPHDFQIRRVVPLKGIKHKPHPVFKHAITVVSLADYGIKFLANRVQSRIDSLIAFLAHGCSSGPAHHRRATAPPLEVGGRFRFYGFIASFKSLQAVNVTALCAGISSVSPVRGLRP